MTKEKTVSDRDVDSDDEWEEGDDEDPVAELLFDILDYFGLDVDIEFEEREDHVRYHIEGADMGVLIGRHGSTLDALQFLVGVINARKKLVDYRVVVDVEGYRDRREKQLRDLARRSADRVQREGREVVLSPMAAGDRRVIHLALADRYDVRTYSEGEDPDRCVVVAPGDAD
ncbi:MAG: RNA-binding cell elongation regulator Jag/EloR [Vulcanimicrobiota bacterium]